MNSNTAPEKHSNNKSEAKKENNSSNKAALVINIQSWATPVVGLVMLIIGLMAGYYGGPIAASLTNSETEAATSPSSTPTSAGAASSGGDGEALMTRLASQTRHYKGDPNAPVTIIEFGDFQ